MSYLSIHPAGMGKYDFLGADVIAAINRTRQPVTPLQEIAGEIRGYDILKYDRNSYLFLRRKDQSAIVLLWLVDLSTVELGTIYIKPECRGGTVLDDIFAALFKICDSKEITLTGIADRFEIDSEVDRQAIFSDEYWKKPDIEMERSTFVDNERNERWMRRLLNYGFQQTYPERAKYGEAYWHIKREPQPVK